MVLDKNKEDIERMTQQMEAVVQQNASLSADVQEVTQYNSELYVINSNIC